MSILSHRTLSHLFSCLFHGLPLFFWAKAVGGERVRSVALERACYVFWRGCGSADFLDEFMRAVDGVFSFGRMLREEDGKGREGKGKGGGGGCVILVL